MTLTIENGVIQPAANTSYESQVAYYTAFEAGFNHTMNATYPLMADVTHENPYAPDSWTPEYLAWDAGHQAARNELVKTTA